SYCEQAVFGKGSETVSLLISQNQAELFKKHYHTPDERLFLLPPGVSRDRMRPPNADEIRDEFRREFNVAEEEKIALMIGTAYKTKGLDRSIMAMANLPAALRRKTWLFVVGEDRREPYVKLAKRLDVLKNIRFFSGRDDVPRFLLGADLLLQPSYRENTGTAILEAIISGLPVLATDVCGYAFHIEKAKAGKVVESPFSIENFARLFEEMLVSPERVTWIKNGLAYAKSEDLYSMPEKAVEIIEMVADRKRNKL
ncbi:MAG: glycosyltransferase family 4 protein, partial [Gammaproteobacteria bacterium]